jgi:hypothetical protein
MLRSAMTRDGRALDHGERPSDVIASDGFHRCTIYRWLTAVRGRGHGLHALASRPSAHGP